jgi:predicted ATPase
VKDCFVGRGDELAQLVELFDEAEGGVARVVLVTGEPGIGKTRLIEELVRAIGARATVVWGRSWDEGHAPAYWPWTQILRAVSPPLLERLRAPAASGDADARFALFDAVAGGLREAAARHPHVIVLDDVHAADPSSLSLLLFVAREVRQARLLIIAAYREAEARATGERRDLLARIGREAPSIELPRLLDDDVRALLESAGIGLALDVVVKHLIATTEGVPLFVHEVVRAMATPAFLQASTAPMPEGVTGVIRNRLAGLAPAVREALERASVVGQTFTVGLVAAASDADVAAVHEAMEAAARAEVLRPIAPGRYAFAQAVVREVLYREIAGGERARLHGRIADALDKAAAAGELGQLAHHALRGAPAIGTARAVGIAITAARSAAALLAFEDASALLTRALAVLDLAPPDAELRARVTAALDEVRRRELREPEASVPSPPPTSPPSSAAALELVPSGEVWTLRLGASLVRLKDARGLPMLARLVARPGEDIHALDLSSETGQAVADGGDAGPVLDRAAVSTYRARLAELEDDAREAEAWNDLGRLERAHAEIDALQRELSRAVGLGGRERRAGALAERARVNVTRRLKDVIRRVAEQDRELGRHLHASVHTGTFCSYRP